MQPWDLKWRAEAVEKVLRKRKALGDYDRRFKPGGLNYQLQEIYCTYVKSGIKLKPKELAELWRKTYADEFPKRDLILQRKNLIRTQLSIAKRIRNLTLEIKKLEGQNGE